MNESLSFGPGAPWRERFRAAAILDSQIASQAPQRGLVASNRSGTLQWYAWDRPTNALRPLTDTPGGHAAATVLSPDGRWVYTLRDEQGNEIGRFVRLPYEGGAAEDVTPGMAPYSAFALSIAHAGSRLIFTLAAEHGFRVYCLDIGPDGALGPPRQVHHSVPFAFGRALSADGQVAVVMTTRRSGKPLYSLLALDAASGEEIAELWDGEGNSLELTGLSPLPGDARCLATTTRAGLETLLLWDPRSGERTDLSLEDVPGALRGQDWSPDGESILVQAFHRAEQRLYLHRLSDRRTLPLSGPPGTDSGAYYSPDGAQVLSHWQDATHPARLIAYDATSGAFSHTVLAAEGSCAGRPWRSVGFPSSDGELIQAWLGLPDGAPGPFPTVIELHGGPRVVRTDAFSPGAQAWMDCGYAVLVLNYRGSTTFGRAFEQRIWGRPGYWEVQDIVAARDWLLAQGLSRPDALLLTGWSYGGYLTLLAPGMRPDLWAGGMAGAAVADWAVEYEDEAEILRGYDRIFFGGSPDQVPDRYRLSSPITYADAVRAPLLIIQGRHDTNTPPRQIELYEARMKALGKQIEVHWYDAGHAGAYASVEEAMAHQELMMRFAQRVLQSLSP